MQPLGEATDLDRQNALYVYAGWNGADEANQSIDRDEIKSRRNR